VNWHFPAAWSISRPWPFTVTTPRRTVASGFKEIRTSRDPLPCPDVEDMMVIQLASVVAFQAHSD
jgi:hypothetical protein